MDRTVCSRRIVTGMLMNYCFLSAHSLYVIMTTLLSAPPGCFGTNSVISQTTSSTTIQQSVALECFLISSTETFTSAILFTVFCSVTQLSSFAFRSELRELYWNACGWLRMRFAFIFTEVQLAEMWVRRECRCLRFKLRDTSAPILFGDDGELHKTKTHTRYLLRIFPAGVILTLCLGISR